MNQDRRDVLQICLINGLIVFFVYKPEPDFSISEQTYKAMAAKLLEGPAKHMAWFNEDPEVTQNTADVIACLKNPFTRRIIVTAKIEERGDKEVSVIGAGEFAHYYNYYVIVNVN